ncbi:MAG: hypothetical protein J6S67_20120 [Methanobrevibacter sp.]|nr:hypothetical protein [Methanobrevibacter sp.]
MVDYKNCTFADIVNDAKANGRTDELKTYGLGTVTVKKTDDDGNKTTTKRKRTFLEIRKWYYSLYYPEMLPKKKELPPTIYDLLEEL